MGLKHPLLLQYINVHGSTFLCSFIFHFAFKSKEQEASDAWQTSGNLHSRRQEATGDVH